MSLASRLRNTVLTAERWRSGALSGGIAKLVAANVTGRRAELFRAQEAETLAALTSLRVNGIPTKLYRAVVIRDGHCRWPGCDRPGWQCDVHHVIRREHGGPTVIENGALFCKFHHHRGAHSRDITVRMTCDGKLHIHSVDLPRPRCSPGQCYCQPHRVGSNLQVRTSLVPSPRRLMCGNEMACFGCGGQHADWSATPDRSRSEVLRAPRGSIAPPRDLFAEPAVFPEVLLAAVVEKVLVRGHHDGRGVIMLRRGA